MNGNRDLAGPNTVDRDRRRRINQNAIDRRAYRLTPDGNKPLRPPWERAISSTSSLGVLFLLDQNAAKPNDFHRTPIPKAQRISDHLVVHVFLKRSTPACGGCGRLGGPIFKSATATATATAACARRRSLAIIAS